MKFIRNNIPNAITSLNLFSGVVAIYLSFNGELPLAAFCIIAAAIFDFFDGLVARLLKSTSNIGKDLDSLADVVSFGVAPVFIYVNLVKYQAVSLVPGFHNEVYRIDTINIIEFIPFFIAVFSAIRLAIFNNDTRQTTSFIGLPTPSNGLLISSFALIARYQPQFFPAFITQPWFVVAFTALSCFLLVMPLPLFAFKFKHWAFKGNQVRYGFVLLAVVLMLVFKFASIPLIIFSYILISFILHLINKTTT